MLIRDPVLREIQLMFDPDPPKITRNDSPLHGDRPARSRNPVTNERATRGNATVLETWC